MELRGPESWLIWMVGTTSITIAGYSLRHHSMPSAMYIIIDCFINLLLGLLFLKDKD